MLVNYKLPTTGANDSNSSTSRKFTFINPPQSICQVLSRELRHQRFRSRHFSPEQRQVHSYSFDAHGGAAAGMNPNASPLSTTFMLMPQRFARHVQDQRKQRAGAALLGRVFMEAPLSSAELTTLAMPFAGRRY